MSEPILKLPAKIDRLKAAAEEEWQLLGKALLAEQQGKTNAMMHRQELGEHLIKLRKEVERTHSSLPSTGGRPRSIWWEWFEEWQPPSKQGHITRDEATRAMKIAGADDPEAAEQDHVNRRRKSHKKSNAKRGHSRASEDDEAQESRKPISLIVRRVEGMIRKMSPEDREVLFERIKELLP